MSHASALPLLVVLALGLGLAACGGDSDAGPLSSRNGLTATPGGSPVPGWSLTSEELCDLITAAEFGDAAGQQVNAEPHTLDGCHYDGEMISARLTETVFSAAEYEAVMPEMGASWVNQVEPGSVVLAYADDGLVINAWFTAGAEALNLSLVDGLGESVVLAIIEAARG